MRNHLKVVWGSFALLVALCVAIPAALAAPVFRGVGSNGSPISLKLLDTRCSDATVLRHLLPLVRPDYLEKFKNAALFYGGKDWAACWIEYDGVIYTIDEEGAQLAPIPRRMFKDDAV